MDPTSLQTLLELRRREEEAARAAWIAAEGRLTAAEAEAERHDDAATRARVRLDDARRQTIAGRAPSGPVPAGAAGTEARFLARLRAEVERAVEAGRAFRSGPLAAARAEEGGAADTHDEKRRAREAAERHEAQVQADLEREAERRAEDARDDVARAVHHARTRDPRP